MGCTETNVMKSETLKVLFEIDLWKLALKKLYELPIPSNLLNDDGDDVGNTIKDI